MRRAAPSALLSLAGGGIVWAVHFLILYGLAALACARGFAAASLFGIGAVPAVIAVATTLAVAGTGILVRRGLAAMRAGAAAGDPTRRFLGSVAAGLAALAALAIAYEGLAFLMLPLCR